MNEQINKVQAEVVADSTALVEVARDNGFNAITVSELINPAETAMYCSIKDDGSMKSKAAIFNTVNSPDKKLSECIGDVIALRNIVAHPITLLDENTGEMIEALRVVLVDDKGFSYEAVSNGVANAVSRILQIFGQPETWAEPVKVKAIQKQTRNGNNKVTTLKIEM